MPGPALETIDRPLTPQEREVVRWLLDHAEINAANFYQQIDQLTVFERCTCGCPTIYFAVNGTPVYPRKGERLISDQPGSVDGMELGLMLFELDGLLSSLEVYSCPGTDKPFGLPSVDSLHTFKVTSQKQDPGGPSSQT